MTSDAWIIGSYATAFGKRPGDSVKTLAREAVLGVVEDARLDDANSVGSVWFGNCGMWVEGQGSVRGQVCLTPLIREGYFPERIPISNVEGGCATASMAFQGAVKDVWLGEADLALAIGVEKTFYADQPELTRELFAGGIDRYDPHEWMQYYREAGALAGQQFNPGPDRTIFMDTYAMQALWHMQHFGTTARQIAAAAAKNHCAAVHNPKAQYRFRMTVDEVLADRPVTAPLTRAMCAPIGDGAAASLICSDAFLATLPGEVKARAVRVAGMALTSGKYRRLDEPGLSSVAASKAYARAGITPSDVHVAEVHDATSFCEIYQAEMLGFCPAGHGGKLAESGETSLGGRIPMNLSGGLVSKGHPVGATGLSMIDELVLQLRGNAGPRQVEGARIGLAENGGGVVGFDEAACSVIILEGIR